MAILGLNSTFKAARIKFHNHPKDYVVVAEDEEVDVWLDTLFNKDSYSFQMVTGLSFVKVSDYRYRITCDQTGFSTVRVKLVTKDKDNSAEIFSNSLLIIVK